MLLFSLRSSGSGGPCAPLTRQTGLSSYSLSPARPRFPFRASLLWRAWTASRSSRSTATTAPPTACHPLTPGKHCNIAKHASFELCCKNVYCETNFNCFHFFRSASTSWTSQPMRATRSWGTCCCWPFRNAQRDSDWLKYETLNTHRHAYKHLI